jgi:hypothetical protein
MRNDTMKRQRQPPPPLLPDPPVALYAVIGRSDDEPVLYHMNLSWAHADSLRVRREAATGRPCFIVPMATWHHDAGAALHRAEQERFGMQ